MKYQHNTLVSCGNVRFSACCAAVMKVADGFSGFCLCRSRKVLRQLSVWCRPTSGCAQRVSRGSPASSLSAAAAAALHAQWGGCLVWVRVCTLGKGLPGLHAMLSVPTTDDLQQLRGDPRYSGPSEPRHRDHLRSLMRRSKRNKSAVQCLSPREIQHCAPASVTEESSPASKEKQDLSPREEQPGASRPPEDPSTSACQDPSSSGASGWLVWGLWPDPLPSVTSHCSRVTLGWVTQGDFSLSSGSGEALGFVSLSGLLHMLSAQPADQRGTVLLRNPSSLQYRYAQLHLEA